MKLKEYLLYGFFIILIILICINSDFVSEGFSEGLSIWYNSIVPLLLPFLLLSGLLMSLIDFESGGKAGALIILFVCGLLCGYPVGAIIINRLYSKNIISKKFAYAIMPLCNNVSPMFLLGYIYNDYVKGYMSVCEILSVIYIPQIIYFVLFQVISRPAFRNRNNGSGNSIFSSALPEIAASEENTADIIENSISTITVIGVYIAVFSVISNIMFYFSNDFMPLKIAACYMEITKGISSINQIIPDITKKTAFILSVTSFGGVSSLLQSMHILKQTKLSFFAYTFGKLICCFASYIITTCMI